ncbi:hypothetical protein MYX76_09870 [Desulfobacterota bacterium AH_259_B03_O07]|nr:hypothetical protein [Desulfobacterota bacterium AH_259_B03_O07]
MGKKLLITFSSIFVFLIISSAASAQNWAFVSSTGNGEFGSYVDVDTIKGDVNLKRFTMYHHFKGKKSYNDLPIARLLAQSVVNCKVRTIGYTEVTYAWADGRRRETVPIPASADVASSKPVLPDSVDEAILEFVCNHE